MENKIRLENAVKPPSSLAASISARESEVQLEVKHAYVLAE